MSDRHLHCVYFQYNNPNKVSGYCLLKNEKIDKGYSRCCNDIVLRPHELLSYFLRHEHYCEDWECADRIALEYLNKTGFNSYPKQQKKINKIKNEEKIN